MIQCSALLDADLGVLVISKSPYSGHTSWGSTRNIVRDLGYGIKGEELADQEVSIQSNPKSWNMETG